jgi:hypothetical protein
MPGVGIIEAGLAERHELALINCESAYTYHGHDIVTRSYVGDRSGIGHDGVLQQGQHMPVNTELNRLTLPYSQESLSIASRESWLAEARTYTSSVSSSSKMVGIDEKSPRRASRLCLPARYR